MRSQIMSMLATRKGQQTGSMVIQIHLLSDRLKGISDVPVVTSSILPPTPQLVTQLTGVPVSCVDHYLHLDDSVGFQSSIRSIGNLPFILI